MVNCSIYRQLWAEPLLLSYISSGDYCEIVLLTLLTEPQKRVKKKTEKKQMNSLLIIW